MKSAYLVVSLCFILSTSAFSEGPVPVGEEFQVNSFTTSLQRQPDVASDADGAFVVVWSSSEPGATKDGELNTRGQRYDSTGAPVGSEFLVHTDTADTHAESAVAIAPSGDFVVTWTNSDYVFFDDFSIAARLYFADGTPSGDQFQVSMYPGELFYGPRRPDVDIASDGSFTVVWDGRGFGSDTEQGVQGQRFSSAGTLVGNQFQINTYTTGNQTGPKIAYGPGDDFLVVWTSAGSSGTDSSSGSVQMQRFGSDGMPVGGELQVNSYTTFSQSGPAVAIAPDGSFLVTWFSFGSSGTDNFNDGSIQARRFASDGSPLGQDFQVNNFTTGLQNWPAVSVNAEGEFVVAWDSEVSGGSDNSNRSIQVRLLQADGTPVGDDFQVNSYTTGAQYTPSVAAADDGRFVVTWSSPGSAGSDSDQRSIQARRLVPSCDDFGGDADADGSCGDFDLCPGFDDALDADGDGVPDGCDLCAGDDATGDSDIDGTCDDLDLCPGSDDTADADFDGVPDGCDLCPGFDDALDADGDGVPDGCDLCEGDDATGDSDKDGTCDDLDLCPGSDDTADADFDGVPDGCDLCPGFDDALDADGDGVPDGCDLCEGDDATGDGDSDGVCFDSDCNDEDPNADAVDACGVCGGDNSTCSIFADGYESGDTSGWDSESP